jgi:hypothetical protein
LQTQRDFPDKIEPLVDEIFRAYIDIAQRVNERTVGIFAANRTTVTGESWFITSQQMQTQRQMYPITTIAASPYSHGIETKFIVGFTRIYGVAYDGTNWYPLPFVSATAGEEIQLHVTPENIVLTAGAGSPPSITKGYIVLEWLARTSSTPSEPSA